MTETHVLGRFLAAIDAQDWEGVRAVLTDDFRGVNVHDGMRFDADGLVAHNRDYPGRWFLEVVELVVDGDRAAARTRVTDGSATYWVASFARVGAGGLITELTEVWTGRVPDGA